VKSCAPSAHAEGGTHDALSPTRKQRVFLEPPRLLAELRSVDVVKTEQAPTPIEISRT
jgi:hypothetical protein